MTENAKKNIIVRPALIPAIRKGRLFLRCMYAEDFRQEERKTATGGWE